MHRSLVFALALFCAPLAHAQQAPLKFDVVSIKPAPPSGFGSQFTPNGYKAIACTLRWIVMQDAFAIYDNKVIYGGPAWLDTDRFTIEAKVADADLDAFNKLSIPQRRQMLRDLLADRFHLVFHREAKESSVYALNVAKDGLKMQQSKPEDMQPAPDGTIMAHVVAIRTGVFEVHGSTLTGIAETLSRNPDIGRIVIDKTGLTARYNYALRWTPGNTPANSPITGGPDIFTALQEQLGLKLDPAKAPIEVTIIDSADHPTPN